MAIFASDFSPRDRRVCTSTALCSDDMARKNECFKSREHSVRAVNRIRGVLCRDSSAICGLYIHCTL